MAFKHIERCLIREINGSKFLTNSKLPSGNNMRKTDTLIHHRGNGKKKMREVGKYKHKIIHAFTPCPEILLLGI